MKVNEPIDHKRVHAVRLTKDAGDGTGPQGVGGQASLVTIQLSAPGGGFGSTSATLVEKAGATDPGSYELQLTLNDASVVGKWQVCITGANIDPYHGWYDVDENEALFYGKVADVFDSTHIDLDATLASGTSGFYANASTKRVCQFKVVEGAGKGQHRRVIDYVVSAGNHRVQIDEAFVTTLDNTSVVRLDAYDTTPTSSQDTRLGNLDAAVSSRATAAGAATALLTSVLGTQGAQNRTVQGVLRRLDWTLLGGGLGLLSALAKVFQYDGSTTGYQSVQNPTQGTRNAATSVAGD